MTPTTAQASGTFLLVGDLPIHRLGFGAMRITGKGIAGVRLSVNTTIGSETQPRYRDPVTTAADGSYVVHGPAGMIRVIVQRTLR